jgi:hypothetical protein
MMHNTGQWGGAIYLDATTMTIEGGNSTSPVVACNNSAGLHGGFLLVINNNHHDWNENDFFVKHNEIKFDFQWIVLLIRAC